MHSTNSRELHTHTHTDTELFEKEGEVVDVRGQGLSSARRTGAVSIDAGGWDTTACPLNPEALGPRACCARVGGQVGLAPKRPADACA